MRRRPRSLLKAARRSEGPRKSTSAVGGADVVAVGGAAAILVGGAAPILVCSGAASAVDRPTRAVVASMVLATIAAITERWGAPRLIGYGCGGSSPFSLSSFSFSFSSLSPRRPTAGHAALTDVRQKLSSIVFVPGVA